MFGGKIVQLQRCRPHKKELFDLLRSFLRKYNRKFEILVRCHNFTITTTRTITYFLFLYFHLAICPCTCSFLARYYRIFLSLNFNQFMMRRRITVTNSANVNSLVKETSISSSLDYVIIVAIIAYVIRNVVSMKAGIHIKLLDIKILTFPCFLLMILLLKIRVKHYRPRKISETIEVLPDLGVQLYSNGKLKRFLAEEDIADVIVSEIVQSLKVITCVCFRVRTMNSTAEIVPAFPSFEMHYHECEEAWIEIKKAIGTKLIK